MYALCVSGAVNRQGFVWMFSMCYKYINVHLFIIYPHMNKSASETSFLHQHVHLRHQSVYVRHVRHQNKKQSYFL